MRQGDKNKRNRQCQRDRQKQGQETRDKRQDQRREIDKGEDEDEKNDDENTSLSAPKVQLTNGIVLRQKISEDLQEHRQTVKTRRNEGRRD